MCMRCLYIRWDCETTLARLRPLLSTTEEELAPPTLPELCLLVRTRPGWKEKGRKSKRGGRRFNRWEWLRFNPALDRDAGEEEVWGNRMKQTWMRRQSCSENMKGKQTHLALLVFTNSSQCFLWPARQERHSWICNSCYSEKDFLKTIHWDNSNVSLKINLKSNFF